jgi:hypothetical protein
VSSTQQELMSSNSSNQAPLLASPPLQVVQLPSRSLAWHHQTLLQQQLQLLMLMLMRPLRQQAWDMLQARQQLSEQTQGWVVRLPAATAAAGAASC